MASIEHDLAGRNVLVEVSSNIPLDAIDKEHIEDHGQSELKWQGARKSGEWSYI